MWPNGESRLAESPDLDPPIARWAGTVATRTGYVVAVPVVDARDVVVYAPTGREADTTTDAVAVMITGTRTDLQFARVPPRAFSRSAREPRILLAADAHRSASPAVWRRMTRRDGCAPILVGGWC